MTGAHGWHAATETHASASRVTQGLTSGYKRPSEHDPEGNRSTSAGMAYWRTSVLMHREPERAPDFHRSALLPRPATFSQCLSPRGSRLPRGASERSRHGDGWRPTTTQCGQSSRGDERKRVGTFLRLSDAASGVSYSRNPPPQLTRHLAKRPEAPQRHQHRLQQRPLPQLLGCDCSALAKSREVSSRKARVALLVSAIPG